MQKINYIRTKLKQSVWLLMACFCVVFSGAVKKIMQMHAEQQLSAQLHTEYDASRALTQNIKDSHREKHEIQGIVLVGCSQIRGQGFDRTLHLPFLQTSGVFLSLHQWASSWVSYRDHEAISSGPTPIFLLLRRLQV